MEDMFKIMLNKCPLCKSDNVKHEELTRSNEVCGPGHHTWIIMEYWVCEECGIMFQKTI